MTTEHVFPQALQAGNLAQATGGMTLRDYFAAKSLQICFQATNEALKKHEDWDFLNEVEMSVIADEAYAMADAMLRARQQPTN